MIIEFDGIPIEISRKKIKNMHLRIYPPDGLVKVSAPLRFSEQL
ncbi:TPA: zinc metalloprotease, partial [Legionella anisa]